MLAAIPSHLHRRGAADLLEPHICQLAYNTIQVEMAIVLLWLGDIYQFLSLCLRGWVCAQGACLFRFKGLKAPQVQRQPVLART